MWAKIKDFFARIWVKIVAMGSWAVIGILALAAILAAIVVAVKLNSRENLPDRPEIAKLFEPSISTPLPPDINPAAPPENDKAGSIAGANTNNQSDNYTSPKSGIDPNEPIPYQNENLKISAILPAHSTINENGNQVKIFGANGMLLYVINSDPATDSLDQIISQLVLSPDARNIKSGQFANNPAVLFTVNNQTGIVTIKNGRTYYIVGQEKYIRDVSL